MDIARPASSYATRGAYGIATCEGCGCGQTLPRPSDDELEAFYAREYAYDAHTLIAPEKRWRARHLLDVSLERGARNVLDVGCMYGFLLDEARARGATVVTGIELSAAPAQSAVARGHDVFCGTIERFVEERPGAAGTYDLITAQHVLEHIPDLPSFLGAAHRLLAPGGRLCIGVPNYAARTRRVFREAWGWYQLPVHLHHFGPEALARLLDANGFSVECEARRGGDSLFVLLTLLQGLGRGPSSETAAPGLVGKSLLRTASVALRPYYFVGDDELIVVARRREPR
jgi:SAM-dependent methyltransferase